MAGSKTSLRVVALRLALALAVLGVFALLFTPPGLAFFFLVRQDSYVLAAVTGLMFAMSVPKTRVAHISLPQLGLTRRWVIALALLMAALLWAGTHALLDDYPLTRDEHMVVFDMQIFRSGHLAAPVPPMWRRYAAALTPAFVLPLPDNAAWASSYMPTNAMLCAAFSTVLDPALMNPLLAALGAVALFGITERIFPERRDAQGVALLLYATSAQVLVTSMMTYAMTAHLALNLLWLMLYLRGTRASHAMAMAVGFVAIGLHQIVFHPLFVLPFIDHLRRQGQWRIAAVYVAAYAVFGLFWISYPHLVALSAGLNSKAGPSAGISGFISARILPLLFKHQPDTIGLMADNLVRFVTWENLALLPLMVLSFGAIRRDEGIARPLAFGIILRVAAMSFLLPYQGHGWGYRYLHGQIASCALLAAYGWRDCSEKEELRRFLGIGTLATVLGSIPFLVWQTAAFVEPYARVNRMLDRIDADMVVVETEGPDIRVDEVRNRPDLSNRPLRLADYVLSPADIAILCRRGTIAFISGKEMEPINLGYGVFTNSSHFQALRRAAPAGCVKR